MGEEHISKVTRARDLITQSEMTLEQPIWGYGIATKTLRIEITEIQEDVLA